ncbi:hypothetical protein PIROE2DRAFT_18908, partial [Piromyces sp. E2]
NCDGNDGSKSDCDFCAITKDYLKLNDAGEDIFKCEKDSTNTMTELTINGVPLIKRNLEYIFAQSALTKLILINNEITDETFPSGVTFPTTLSELTITNNKLTEVPDWIKTSEQKVNLSNNLLSTGLCNSINGQDGYKGEEFICSLNNSDDINKL